MTISTYDELRVAVASWLARDDLADQVPDFIALAEARINRLIRTRDMETRATASTTAGSAFLDLPESFGGVRYVKLQTDPATLLQPMSPTQIETVYAGPETGRPKVYAIVGDAFRLAPTPDAAYTVEISYARKVPALSASATTNWLLSAHPDVYLFGALVCAEMFLGNDARIALWKASFDEALAELENQDATDRWSGGPLAIRTDTGSP
jgi:hypothetical protein